MSDARQLAEQGFVVLPRAVPRHLVMRAAALVGAGLPPTMDASEVARFTQRSFVPELAEDERLLALYRDSSLRPFCEALFLPETPAPVSRAQIQLRLPLGAVAQPDKPLHVDGIACKHLPAGTLNTFTLLVGVLLGKVDERSGPLEALPRGHRFMASWLKDHEPEDLPEGHEVPVELQRLERRRILGEPGDAVVAHHLTPHAAGQNTGETPRAVVYFRLRHVKHDVLARRALTDPWLELPALRALA